MTRQEREEKYQAALKIGRPIFLTAAEIGWLEEHLLAYAERWSNLAPNQMTVCEKLELLHAVSIGIKCAKETI